VKFSNASLRILAVFVGVSVMQVVAGAWAALPNGRHTVSSGFHVSSGVEGFAAIPYGCMSRISTTSESVCPWTTASLFPSRDQS
jgi:hypothetical protein